MTHDIFSPQTLPCGRTVPNRLVKVALYEHLGPLMGGPPTAHHVGLYASWAAHGWGMIITGNVQIDAQHLSLGRDIVIPKQLNDEMLAPFRRLARAIHGDSDASQSQSQMPLGDGNPVGGRSLAIMQISHAGRQSPVLIGGRSLFVQPLAPSAVRVGSAANGRVVQDRSGKGKSNEGKDIPTRSAPVPVIYATLFQVPREMTLEDIHDVQQGFVRAALTAFKAGFDGVQVHCAHGYLLAQFLNPKTNLRQDAYSVVPSENALRMLREIIEAIRAAVPPDFILGLKINSADYIPAGERPTQTHICAETDRVLDHVCIISSWGTVDFIEISGGDYESPDFVAAKHTTPRQAFFAHFSKVAMEHIHDVAPPLSSPTSSDTQRGSSPPLILLTGGLRSPAHLHTALAAGHAHLLGIGRGAILCPDLPARLWARLRHAERHTKTREEIGIKNQARKKHGDCAEAQAETGIPLEHDTAPFTQEPDAAVVSPFWLPSTGLMGASARVSWYTVRMRELAEAQVQIRGGVHDGAWNGRPRPQTAPVPVPLPPHTMGSVEATVRMWIWINGMQYRLMMVGGGIVILVGLVGLVL